MAEQEQKQEQLAARSIGVWSCFPGPLTDSAKDNTHLIAQNDAIVERCICHTLTHQHIFTGTPHTDTHIGRLANGKLRHSFFFIFGALIFKGGCKNRTNAGHRGSCPGYVFKPQQKTLESISLAFCDDSPHMSSHEAHKAHEAHEVVIAFKGFALCVCPPFDTPLLIHPLLSPLPNSFPGSHPTCGCAYENI